MASHLPRDKGRTDRAGFSIQIEAQFAVSPNTYTAQTSQECHCCPRLASLSLERRIDGEMEEKEFHSSWLAGWPKGGPEPDRCFVIRYFLLTFLSPSGWAAASNTGHLFGPLEALVGGEKKG